MNVFDKFLGKVISTHSDEFQEPQDIVSRYKTLKESNDRLKKSQQMSEMTIEELSQALTSY